MQTYTYPPISLHTACMHGYMRTSRAATHTQNYTHSRLLGVTVYVVCLLFGCWLLGLQIKILQKLGIRHEI